ncbi:unnamed protein product [Rotaria socialis]|uniref:Uncharacterized protein n=2 Tax=Rotaria socialis TaxID=392032 RepID=A0A818C1T1_9BILA|nr:unnamed protein product [Rotaria socialis]CAF3383107.1 unnamed protein product [Rotaria socialis]CAF3402769.1 unnamed protein product [Rotaria socialis]CAF3417860.1 unnamed protein product [Rotaria socialis]
MLLINVSPILLVLIMMSTADLVSSINCAIYKSDKEIIFSLPFLVFINPDKRENLTYAMVDDSGGVTELHIFQQRFIPFSIFCLTQLKTLSIISSKFDIPPEISRLSSTLKQLTILNLPKPQKTLPAELLMLHNLTMLNLSNCGIEIVSDAIANLTRLRILNLKGNKLFGSLPSAIKQLRALKILDISGNSLINSLDVLNGSTSLRELRAADCGVDHLPLFLPCLSTLDMSGNKLTSLVGIETPAIPGWYTCTGEKYMLSTPGMLHSSNLTEFDFSNNKLMTVPEEIYGLQYLRKINLKNNQINIQEREWIIGRFRGNYNPELAIII